MKKHEKSYKSWGKQKIGEILYNLQKKQKNEFFWKKQEKHEKQEVSNDEKRVSNDEIRVSNDENRVSNDEIRVSNDEILLFFHVFEGFFTF